MIYNYVLQLFFRDFVIIVRLYHFLMVSVRKTLDDTLPRPKDYIFFLRSLRLFATTLTLLSAIAAPAIIGFSRNPVTG